MLSGGQQGTLNLLLFQHQDEEFLWFLFPPRVSIHPQDYVCNILTTLVRDFNSAHGCLASHPKIC